MSTGSIKAARAWVELVVDDNKLSRGLQRAELELRAFANRLTSIGTQTFGLGAAMLAPIGYAVRQFAELDDTLRLVRAVTRSTTKEFETLTAKARFLGKTTSFTSQQVAEAMANLGRAGFGANQIDKMIKNVMNLARATQTNVATAAEITGNAMRQFGMDAKDTGRIVDVLTTAANNSSQTLEDIATSFKYAAPVAKEFGMAIEEVAYYVGVLANQGLRGEMAGTSLRNLLARLGGQDVQAQFEKVLKVSLRTNGHIKSLRDILSEANEKMNELGWDSYQRQEWLHKTFGLRSMAGGAKLVSAGDQYGHLFEALMNSEGEAERTAKQMDEGIGGAIRITISALQELGNVIAESIVDELKDFGKWLQQTTNRLITFFKYNKHVVLEYTKFAVTLAKYGAIFFTTGAILRTVGTILGSLGATFGALSKITAVLTARNILFCNSVGTVTTKLFTMAGATRAFAVAAGTTGAVLTSWLPIIGAVALALGGLYRLIRGNKDLKILTQKTEEADSLKRSFGQDEASLRRLSQINKMQSKSNEVLEEASNIVSDLQAKYGDLGLSISKATKEIEGMAEAQRRLKNAENIKLEAANDEALEEMRQNVEKLDKTIDKAFGKAVYWKQDLVQTFDVTKFMDMYGSDFLSRPDWFKVVREGVAKKDLKTFDTLFKDIKKPVHYTDDTGKTFVASLESDEENRRKFARISDLYRQKKETRQKIFDIEAEQELLNNGGANTYETPELPRLETPYPNAPWKTPYSLKSADEIMAMIEKKPFSRQSEDQFDEYRFNLINRMGDVLEEQQTNRDLQYQAETNLSENELNQKLGVYTRGAGFTADNKFTRLGMFGKLGRFGRYQIGQSELGDNALGDFEMAANNFEFKLKSHLQEGSEEDQAYRRIILKNFQDFRQAYTEALIAGTANSFDFSKWTELSNYEAEAEMKELLETIDKKYKDRIKEIEGSVQQAGRDEAKGLTLFKIFEGKDANGNDIYRDNGKMYSEQEAQSIINGIKEADATLKELKEEADLVASEAQLIATNQSVSFSDLKTNTFKAEQEKTHEQLYEILHKMDREFNFLRNQAEVKAGGQGNPYQDAHSQVDKDLDDEIAKLRDWADKEAQKGVTEYEGMPLEKFVKKQIAYLRDMAAIKHQTTDWEYGVFDNQYMPDSEPYSDRRYKSREKKRDEKRIKKIEEETGQSLTPGEAYWKKQPEETEKQVAGMRSFTIEGDEAIGDFVEGKEREDVYERERQENKLPLLNLNKGDIRAAIADGLLDPKAFGYGLWQKKSGDYAINDNLEYRGTQYELGYDGVYRPTGERWREYVLSHDTAENHAKQRAGAVEEQIKSEKPTTIPNRSGAPTQDEIKKALPTGVSMSDWERINREIDENGSSENQSEAERAARIAMKKPVTAEEYNKASGTVKPTLRKVPRFQWEKQIKEAHFSEELENLAMTFFGENIATLINPQLEEYQEEFSDKSTLLQGTGLAEALEEKSRLLSQIAQVRENMSDAVKNGAEMDKSDVDALMALNNSLRNVNRKIQTEAAYEGVGSLEEVSIPEQALFDLSTYQMILDKFTGFASEDEAQAFMDYLLEQSYVVSPNEPMEVNGKRRQIAEGFYPDYTESERKNAVRHKANYEYYLKEKEKYEKNISEDTLGLRHQINRSAWGGDKMQRVRNAIESSGGVDEFLKQYKNSYFLDNSFQPDTDDEAKKALMQKIADDPEFSVPVWFDEMKEPEKVEPLSDRERKLIQIPENLKGGDSFRIDGVKYDTQSVDGEITGYKPDNENPQINLDQYRRMIGTTHTIPGLMDNKGLNVQYFPSAVKAEAKRIKREARMRRNDMRYELHATDQDEANKMIDYQKADLERQKEIAQRAGNDSMVKAYDADIAELEREKVANEYEREKENIDRLEKRRNIDARQYKKDSLKLKQAEKIYARNKKGMSEQERKEAEANIEQLRQRKQRSKEQYWKSNKNYNDAALMIQAYETAVPRSLWDIRNSFSSKGSFDLAEMRGTDTATIQADLKQQTELLGSIDENIAAMASGEWI